jgi:hypothetical protein
MADSHEPGATWSGLKEKTYCPCHNVFCDALSPQVMNARASDMEAVSDAMEMAVLSSVQHPNIVQVYCCLTDMIEVKGDEGEQLNCACVRVCARVHACIF